MNTGTPKYFTTFEDLPVADPAVESLLGQGKRRRMEAHPPQKERAHIRKERGRAEKSLPNRIGLDLPVELKSRLMDQNGILFR